MAQRQEFTAELQQKSSGVVYAVIPFDPRTEWGRRVRHYFSGTINGEPYQGSLGVRGGEWFFPINKEARTRLGIAAGDTITVSIEPSEKPEG